MSRVDVFVPCYKYAHYLRACVQSVLLQDGVDVRVLILDDCSPDNTPEVARQLMSEDGRVEYHRNPVNRGHIDTYNIGIEWCSGDYCLLLSADDVLTEGSLRRAVTLLDAHPQAGFAFGREIRTSRADYDSWREPAAPYATRVLSTDEFWARCIRVFGNPVPTPSAVIRTALQKQAGGYRRELPHSGDLEMWLRLASHAPVAELDIVQAFYRTHGENMSCTYLGLSDLTQRLEAFETALRGCGDRLSNVPELRARVRKRLSEEAYSRCYAALECGDERVFDQILDFALSNDLGVSGEARWRKLRWKRRMGYRFVSFVRPAVTFLRGWRRRVPG